MSKSVKRFSLVSVLLLTVALLSEAQNHSKTHDVYEALTGVNIKVDGKMSDWDGVFDAVVGTNGKPFRSSLIILRDSVSVCVHIT